MGPNKKERKRGKKETKEPPTSAAASAEKVSTNAGEEGTTKCPRGGSYILIPGQKKNRIKAHARLEQKSEEKENTFQGIGPDFYGRKD